jgi:hypothetical protein
VQKGQDLKKDSMVLMRSIYSAKKAQNKKEHLEAFLDDFELLKLEVRLCTDMKITSHWSLLEQMHSAFFKRSRSILTARNSFFNDFNFNSSGG